MTPTTPTASYAVPVIDVAALVQPSAAAADRARVAAAIGAACREAGFFYVVGHGVSSELQARLERLSRAFFALPAATKLEVAMAKAGRAWRGYFPVGAELTSGRPDLKEGYYFGRELGPEHPDVAAGLPLHGANLFPASMPELRDAVLAYLDAMTGLGHALMTGVALSLGLDAAYFRARYTGDPLVLFRIFNYPTPRTAADREAEWGVGEHTDYGVLTILRQDDCGGLEVKTRGGWVSAPPIDGSFVCNIGDMLDRMTSGLYRSTPHRVRNASGRDRLSWPFFFDPSFHAEVKPVPLPAGTVIPKDQEERWDKADVHAFQGTYGDYLLRKVGKVFPDLKAQALGGG
jgi:isopenicillin N synthase-like dioxygenase